MFYIAVTIVLGTHIYAYQLAQPFSYREKCESNIDTIISQWRTINKRASVEFECRKHQIIGS